MALFDRLIDDTTPLHTLIFGELVVLLREMPNNEYQVVRYMLKHGILPDPMNYDDYKDEIFPDPKHNMFIARLNRYIPKVEKWCKDNNCTITNLDIIKEGTYPLEHDYLEIPEKPEFKFNYLSFLKNNWKSLLAMYAGMITVFTVIGYKIGYRFAYVELERLLAVNNQRQKAALVYTISVIPLVVYLGFLGYFLIGKLL